MSKEVIIRSDKHNLVVSNAMTVKSILKHTVVLSFLILATVLLFWKINVNSLVTIIKNPSIAIETFTVYFLMYFQLRNTVKMINYSNSSMIFSSCLAALSFGYSIFLVVWFENWNISKFADLINIIWFYLPIACLMVIWKGALILFERRANPMLSRTLIVGVISSIIWVAIVSFGYFIIKWYIIDKTFDMHSFVDMFNVVVFGLLGMLFIMLSIITAVQIRRHNMSSVLKKSITYSGALILLIPFTIWFAYFSFTMSSSWQSIMYLFAYVFMGGLAIYIGIFWKNALGSPLIVSTIYMLIITVSWALSMLATILDPGSEHINYLFSKICPLVVTAIVVILIYFKNPKVPFIETLCWVFIIATMFYWLVEVADIQSQFEDLKASGVNNDQIWSMLLLVDGVTTLVPVFVLAINVVRWFIVQRTIKSKSGVIKKKAESNKRKQKNKLAKMEKNKLKKSMSEVKNEFPTDAHEEIKEAVNA